MPYETLRFIHAARVLVDHPLHETGPLGGELRGLARDATTLAFRRLIRACVEQDVDFLLLTGDTLAQSDFSIKARVELRRGFEQLDEAGIQVFLIPGTSDPAPVWNDFPELPGNVTVFRPETDDPVAVIRDGAVIASIRSCTWRQAWFASDDEVPYADRVQRRVIEADDAEAKDSDHTAQREVRRVHSPAELRPNHFAIATVRDGVDSLGSDPQADYVAVVGAHERTTNKGADWLLHFPGSTQGLSPDEPGLCGCSLVDLDGDGVIRCRMIPTAVVLWENCDIELSADTSFDEMLRNMKSLCQVGRTPPSDGSDVGVRSTQGCFLRWTIRGHGPLFDSLLSESAQAELSDWLNRDADWPSDVPRWHRFRLLATEPADVSSPDFDATEVENEQLDVRAEYFWRVDQAQPLGSSAWSNLADDSPARERLLRVQGAEPNCDAEVVFSFARRRGRKWFEAHS